MAPHVWGGPVVTAASLQLDARIPNVLIQESTCRNGGFFNELVELNFVLVQTGGSFTEVLDNRSRRRHNTSRGNMPKSLYQNWQFAIQVNGFDVALFRKGTDPGPALSEAERTEFEEMAFAPAGPMFDQKVAGRVKLDDVTLEKGILQDGSDTVALDWIKQEVDVNEVTGQLPDEYMRDIDIVRYDRSGKETRRWTLHGAWVKVLECDDLEGGNTENSIEKLTVCFQYWT